MLSAASRSAEESHPRPRVLQSLCDSTGASLWVGPTTVLSALARPLRRRPKVLSLSLRSPLLSPRRFCHVGERRYRHGRAGQAGAIGRRRTRIYAWPSQPPQRAGGDGPQELQALPGGEAAVQAGASAVARRPDAAVGVQGFLPLRIPPLSRGAATTPGANASRPDRRFLRARRWVVQDAFKQFKDTEDWRSANHLDILYDTIDVESYEQSRRLVRASTPPPCKTSHTFSLTQAS